MALRVVVHKEAAEGEVRCLEAEAMARQVPNRPPKRGKREKRFSICRNM